MEIGPLQKWIRKNEGINEIDLQDFRRGKPQEGIDLEFKGAKDYEKEPFKITKTISAFANSGGGLLIVGLNENRNVEPPIAGDFEPLDISRESLENKLFSNLDPWPSSTRIIPVAIESGLVYLIEVPGNHFPPVMDLHSHSHFFRLNFSSIPMDSNMLQQAFNKGLKPDLVPILCITGHKEQNEVLIEFSILIMNEGRAAATECIVIMDCSIGQIKIGGGFEKVLDFRLNGNQFLRSRPMTVYMGPPSFIGNGTICLQRDFYNATIDIFVSCIEVPTTSYQRTLNYDEWLDIICENNKKKNELFKINLNKLD